MAQRNSRAFLFAFIMCILAPWLSSVYAGAVPSRGDMEDAWVYDEATRTLFTYITETMPYNTAKARCEAMGATLHSSVGNVPGAGSNWIGLKRDRAEPDRFLYFASGRELSWEAFTESVDVVEYDEDFACYYSIADASTPVKRAPCNTTHGVICERPLTDRPFSEWQRVDEIQEFIVVPHKVLKGEVGAMCSTLFNAFPLFIDTAATAKDKVLLAADADPLVDLGSNGIFTGVDQSSSVVDYVGEVNFHSLLGNTDRFAAGTTASSANAPLLIRDTQGDPIYTDVDPATTYAPFGCSRAIRQFQSFAPAPGAPSALEIGGELEIHLKLNAPLRAETGRVLITAEPAGRVLVSPNVLYFPNCSHTCGPETQERSLRVYGVQAGAVSIRSETLTRNELSRAQQVLSVTVLAPPTISFSPPGPHALQVGEMRTITATLSRAYDIDTMETLLIPPVAQPPEEPVVSISALVFDHMATSAQVNITGLRVGAQAAYRFTQVAAGVVTVRIADPPPIVVQVTSAPAIAILQLTPGATIIYDNSTVLTLTVQPDVALPRAVSVTLVHNCSAQVFFLSAATWNFEQGVRTSHSLEVTSAAIEGKELYCELSFVLDHTDIVEQPPSRTFHIRRRISIEFVRFPHMSRQESSEPAIAKIPYYWEGGHVTVTISGTGLSRTVNCGSMTFNPSQLTQSVNCVTQSGSTTATAGSISYSISGPGAARFRPAAEQPELPVRQAPGTNNIVHLHARDYRYDNFFVGVAKKMTAWVRNPATAFSGVPDRVDVTVEGGCSTSIAVLSNAHFTSSVDEVSLDYNCPSAGNSIGLQRQSAANGFVDGVQITSIVWRSADERFVVRVDAPPALSVEVDSAVVLYVSVPTAIANGKSITLTITSASVARLEAGATTITFESGDTQLTSRPIVLNGKQAGDSEVVITQDSTDPSFKSDAFELFRGTFTVLEVIPVVVEDPSSSEAKANFNASFPIHVSTSVAPVSEYVVELFVEAAINPGAFVISPATHTLADTSTKTFTVEGLALAPGIVTLAVRCVTCPTRITTSSLNVTIRELTFFAVELNGNPQGVALGGTAVIGNVFAVGNTATVNSGISPVLPAGVDMTSAPPFVSSALNSTVTLVCPPGQGTFVIEFSPEFPQQFVNEKFSVIIRTFGAWEAAVSSPLSSQVLVTGKSYSAGVTVGQFFAFHGPVTAQHAPLAGTNFSFAVSPATPVSFSAGTTSRSFTLAADHPMIQVLNFTIGNDGGFVSPWASSAVAYRMVPKMHIGVLGAPSGLIGGVENVEVLRIYVGTPPATVPEVTFTITKSGVNEANLTLNTTSFTRVWGQHADLEAVELLGLGDANVSLSITASNPEWYHTFTGSVIEVQRQRMLFISVDHVVLYGVEDAATVEVVIETPLAMGQTLELTPVFSAVGALRTAPDFHEYVVADPDGDLKVFSFSANSSFVAPEEGMVVSQRFALDGTERRMFVADRMLNFTLFPHLNVTVGVAGDASDSTIFSGARNNRSIAVAVTQVPKATRLLNASFNCRLDQEPEDAAFFEGNCSLSRSWYVFTNTSDSEILIFLTTHGRGNVSVCMEVDQPTSNATEFHPYLGDCVNFTAQDTINTSLVVMDGTRFVPPAHAVSVNVTVEGRALAPTDTLQVAWVVDVGGVFSSTPSELLFTSASAPQWWQLVSFSHVLPSSELPLNISVRFIVSGPPRFAVSTTPDTASFMLVPPKNITVATFSENIFVDGGEWPSYVNITVPAPDNAGFHVVNLSMSCNSSAIVLESLHEVFNTNELFRQIRVGPANTSAEVVRCDMVFEGPLSFEYLDLALSVVFTVWPQRDAVVLQTEELYVGETGIVNITIDNDALQLCPRGSSVSMSAYFSSASELAPLTFQWNAGVPAESIVRSFIPTVPTMVTITFVVSGSCFAVNRTVGHLWMQVFAADDIVVSGIPQFVFVDEDIVVTIFLNNSVPITDPGNTTLRLTFGGALNALRVSAPTVQPVSGRSWDLSVLPNGPMWYNVTLRGLSSSPEATIRVEVREPESRQKVFGQERFFGRNSTMIPAVQEPIITSNVSYVADGFNSAGGVAFQTQLFTVSVTFPPTPAPVVLGLHVVYNNSFFRLLADSGLPPTPNQTAVFHFETLMSGLGQTQIQFAYNQSSNLYFRPLNGTITVMQRKQVTLEFALPLKIRTGTENSRPFAIRIQAPPTQPRASPAVRISVETSNPVLTVSPAFVDIEAAESSLVRWFNVTASSTHTSPINVSFAASTIEFEIGASLASHAVEILPLGTVYVSGLQLGSPMAERVFVGQSMIVTVALDHPPLDVPLTVSPQMDNPSMMNIESLDEAARRNVTWEAGAPNTTQQLECFGALTSEGAEPMLFIPHSREFSGAFVCIGRTACAVHIIPSAIISAANECTAANCPPVILYANETEQLQVFVTSCFNQSQLTVVPSFDDFPNALVFEPPQFTWDCSQLVGEDSFTFQMRALAGDVPGRDPTERPSLVYVESRETVQGQTKVTFGAFRINVEVRARQRIEFWLQSNISYHKPVNLTLQPLRFPAKQPIVVHFREVAAASSAQLLRISPESGLMWDVQTGTPAAQNFVINARNVEQQVDVDLIQLRLELSSSANEFFLSEDESDFHVFTNFSLRRTPRISIDGPPGIAEFFVGIDYTMTVSLTESPDTPLDLQLASDGAEAGSSSATTQQLLFVLSGLAAPTATLRIPVGETLSAFHFRAAQNGSFTFRYTFDPLQKFDENITTNLSSVVVHPLIYPNVSQLQLQLRGEQYVQQKNSQMLRFAIRTPPAGGRLEVALQWVVSPSPVTGITDFAIDERSSPWVVQSGIMSKEFTIFRNSPTPEGATPGTLYLVFTEAPREFRTTRIFLGTIRFLRLFVLRDPPVSAYTIFMGQSVVIPVSVDGYPPPIDRVQNYVVSLSDRSGLTSISPNATTGVVFNSANPLQTSFTVVADRGASGSARLQFLHLTMPDSFDVRRNIFVDLVVLPLRRIDLTLPDEQSPADRVSVGSFRVFKNSENSIVVGVTIPPVSTQLVVEVRSNNIAAVRVQQELSTAPPTFVIAASASPQLRFFRLIGVATPEELDDNADGDNSDSDNAADTPSSGQDRPVGIVVTTTGAEEVEAELFAPVTVLQLFGYVMMNIPTTFFSGELNGRTFSIRPQVADNITLRVSLTCEGATVRPQQLQWVESVQMLDVFVAAASAQVCFLSASQVPDLAKPTFDQTAFTQQIVVTAAPEITLTYIAQDQPSDRLTAEAFRTFGITFRLSLQGRMLLPTGNITVGTDLPHSSILLNSSHTETESPQGFMAMMRRFNDTISWNVYDLGRDRIDIVIPAMPEYVSYVDETITIRVTEGALVNRTFPNPLADRVTLLITGDPPLPPENLEKVATEITVFAAATVSGVMSLSSAAQAGKVLSIASLMRCPSMQWIDDQNDVPFYISIVPVRLGTNAELGVYAGVVVANLALLGLFVLVHYGACRLLLRLRGADGEFTDVARSVSFPALVWFPLLLYFQATFVSASRVTLYSSVASLKIIGSVGVIAFLFATPGVLARVLTKAEDLEYLGPQRKGVMRWLFERGIYRHPTNESWVQRYALPILSYRGETRWYAAVEIGVLIMLSIMTAIDPKEHAHCVTRAVIAFIIFVLQLFAIVLIQPYSSKFENFFFIGAYGLQVIAMVIVLRSTVEQADSELEVQHVLTTFAVALAIKALIDWWDALRSGIKMCSIFDSHSTRRFRTARRLGEKGQRSGEPGEKVLGDASLEEGLLHAPENEEMGNLSAPGLSPRAAVRGASGKRLRGRDDAKESASAAEALQRARQLAPLATATVIASPNGMEQADSLVLVGFQRAMDPSVAVYDDHQLANRNYNDVEEFLRDS